jgi:hypothetical protein
MDHRGRQKSRQHASGPAKIAEEIDVIEFGLCA